jgi:hypothetical protein
MTEKRRIVFDEDDFLDPDPASNLPESKLSQGGSLPPVQQSHPLPVSPDPAAPAAQFPQPPSPPPGAVQATYVVPQKTNGMAIASLVLGILWLYWIGSLLALIFGVIGKNQIDRSGGVEGGRGLAVAGIVLGIVGLGIFILLLIIGASIVGSA